MRCSICNSGMVPTGIMCICGHKQYACPKCKNLWSYNHKTPGSYERDWDAEHKIKELVKKHSDKLNAKSYDEYINKMMVEWKKNLK